MPSEPVIMRGLVREDVAEQVLGDDHVEAARLAHQQHRARVDELVREPHVGVVAARPPPPPAPRAARPRARSPCGRASRACGAARAASNATRAMRAISTSSYTIVLRASRLPSTSARAARLAEVEPAGELAHHQQVDARRPPRAAASRRSTSAGNTVAGRRFANRPSSLRMRSRPLLGTRGRPASRPTSGRRRRRAARRAALARALDDVRRASGVPCASIDAPPIRSSSKPSSSPCCGATALEHAPRLARHLRADAVARQDQDALLNSDPLRLVRRRAAACATRAC